MFLAPLTSCLRDVLYSETCKFVLTASQTVITYGREHVSFCDFSHWLFQALVPMLLALILQIVVMDYEAPLESFPPRKMDLAQYKDPITIVVRPNSDDKKCVTKFVPKCTLTLGLMRWDQKGRITKIKISYTSVLGLETTPCIEFYFQASTSTFYGLLGWPFSQLYS